MCKFSDCAIASKLTDLVNKNAKPEVVVKEEKKANVVVIVLAIIGAVAAVAGIAYAVYRYLTPDYLDQFDDEYEDDDMNEDEFEDDSIED